MADTAVRSRLIVYVQSYDPLGNAVLSPLLAAVPVAVLFYLLVFRRMHVPWAAAWGALAALLLASTFYKMPVHMAGLAFVNGALFGLLPVCWTIVAAMFLYNITVETGKFEGIKNSVAGLSADHRLQAVLIGFSFGAFLEGAAGGGTPVAICAAMLVGLGFDPFLAAALCLIANTSPVAYGGFGTPIMTLSNVTGLDGHTLSKMAGNQLPLLSCIVPLWLVRSMCNWQRTKEVLPAIAVAGGSFAVIQYFFAHSVDYWNLTDIAGGLLSLIITAAFLCFWKPKNLWRFDLKDDASAEETARVHAAAFVKKASLADTFSAWWPYLLLCVLMVTVGLGNGSQKRIDHLEYMGGASFRIPTKENPANPSNLHPFSHDFHIPDLDLQVKREPPVVPQEETEKAVFVFNWFTMPGTSVFLSALLTLVLLKVSREQLGRIVKTTWKQMAIPVPTIVCMLGLASVTRYAGLDATLGLAFRHTGATYPFFAAILGWLGVFLTGTDAGSNALFGSLQKMTAVGLMLSPVLICVANSTGGVMGKMIDAQSICVATAATEKIGTEADIFKFVLWHSITLACIVGAICLLQAYVPPFTAMVPAIPH